MLDIASFATFTEHGMKFSQTQASQFAKGVARDFNPIHDVGGKRFCVPGDLLFACLLNRYGAYQQLHVNLVALVNADVEIGLPHQLAAENEIRDSSDRHLLSLNVSGESTGNTPEGQSFVNSLVVQYVRFSGMTFPDILVDLMREHNVMLNPTRPLVIYKDMSLALDRLHGENLSLSLDKATMDIDGKKGKVCLRFIVKSSDSIIGRGEKNMLLSGLRDFDQPAMDDIVDQYAQWKIAYEQSTSQAM